MYLRDYSQIFKFEDFTYNETNNYFYAHEVSVSTSSALGEIQDSYYNVEIKFAGNNVSSIVYYDYAQQKTSYTFSYTDFVVEAPYIPVGPVTNVSAWTSALDLTRYDNVTMIQNRQDGSLYGKLLWDGVNLCYMTYTHTQAGDITVGILVVKEGDEYYRYQDNNTGQWKNKTLIDEDTYNSFVFSYLGLAEQYYFDDFDYNPASEMYEADCITQHGQGETATIYNVKVEIKNDKVNKLTYTYLQETVTATYTYDDVTIELPGSN